VPRGVSAVTFPPAAISLRAWSSSIASSAAIRRRTRGRGPLGCQLLPDAGRFAGQLVAFRRQVPGGWRGELLGLDLCLELP
jgi:hypothetical protein